MKRNLILAGLVLAVAAAAVWAQASGTNYFEQGGARTVIGGALDVISGGEIDVESGGALKIGGTAVTATAAELNYLDITAAGTAQASKALITDASIDIGGLRNVTATGTVQGANVTATAALTGATAVLGGGFGSSGISTTDAGNLSMDGALVVGGVAEFKVASVTVADDGAGTKPAGAIPITAPIALCECNDATGCTMSIAEPTVTSGYGRYLTIISTGTGNCEFADSAGVLELSGAVVLDAPDVLSLVYANSAWHMLSNPDLSP